MEHFVLNFHKLINIFFSVIYRKINFKFQMSINNQSKYFENYPTFKKWYNK